MRFSNKASKYLAKLKRNNEFIVSREKLVDYFKRHNIPEFEKIIEFQIDFSGLELTIKNKNSSKFNAFLISKENISKNEEIEYLIVNNKYYFFCGDHETAQFWFVISESGEICTYDNNDETVNIIYSSFEKFIESYAFIDLINQNKKYEYPGYFSLIENNHFDELTKNYFIHNSSNDEFNKWISTENLIINIGIWLHEHSFYIHIYGETKSECEKFIEVLKEEKIIK
ncbi:hypothetical protein [Flavobacterium hydrophilum]|uniref:SMI1/KNR4 family protein n=1 Tax=Flavobacterium hydrophilum TaxID=2211445 RepID=A0A2V4C6U3_9FLAO|nr:hypothetical protein [Flavobacterium hydrophilum]PXY47096.1 hypothetical protein DMB68_08105 [Flavobacterium hydrophilum]